MAEGNTGASLTREKSVYLTSQWCEAEPLCWTLSGLLPCSQVWWLGQGFCWWLWLLWVLGCPSLTPFLVFELFSSPLLLEEIASQSWPGNMIYNLWRRIRSLKLISQDSGITELQVTACFWQKWTSDRPLPLGQEAEAPGDCMQNYNLLEFRSWARSQIPVSQELVGSVLNLRASFSALTQLQLVFAM